jgi:2-polyprenyl-3-methyl-5-hydroxy-6-metoxy-1,4-benzoquinol methylase
MLTALAVLLLAIATVCSHRIEKAWRRRACLEHGSGRLGVAYTSGMQFNRLMFWLFYRVGTPPWEGHPLPERLRELIEGPSALPPGKALDVGCGTGDTSIYLARRGWDVTAFDFMNVALKRARAKAEAAAVSIRTMQADVTRLTPSEVGVGFHLIVDNGLLHGLSDAGRDAYVRLVSTIAAPNATLLLAGFAEKKRRGPRGYDRPEVERRFAAGWELLGHRKDPAISSRPDDPVYVYELRHR